MSHYLGELDYFAVCGGLAILAGVVGGCVLALGKRMLQSRRLKYINTKDGDDLLDLPLMPKLSTFQKLTPRTGNRGDALYKPLGGGHKPPRPDGSAPAAVPCRSAVPETFPKDIVAGRPQTPIAPRRRVPSHDEAKKMKTKPKKLEIGNLIWKINLQKISFQRDNQD